MKRKKAKAKRYENRFVWESDDNITSDPDSLAQIMDDIQFATEQSPEENIVIFELVPRFTIVEKRQLIQKKFKRES